MKYSIPLILLFSSTISLAQDNYTLPVVKGKVFPVFIEEAFRNNFNNKLDTLGLNGFCWVKFKVGTDSSLQKMEISPGTHPILSKFIKEILLTTNGLWEFRTDIEWFILPIRYTLQKNGKTKNVNVDPYELEAFLLEENGLNKQLQYTFLPIQEFVSPFDRNNSWKMKITKDTERNNQLTN